MNIQTGVHVHVYAHALPGALSEGVWSGSSSSSPVGWERTGWYGMVWDGMGWDGMGAERRLP